VFAEKPLAVDWEQWDAMRSAARRNERVCAMFGLRGEPAFQAARAAASRIGDIRLMHAQKSYKLGTRGPVYLRRKDYGGIFPWVGIHALDWIRWISGKEYMSVFGAQCCKGNVISTELEISAAALFTMEDDTIATISADFLRPAAAARHDDDQLRITGTKGTLFVRGGEAFLELSDKPITRLPLPNRESLCADFMAQLEGGKACGLTVWDALNVTAAALAAREAADDHTPVAVPIIKK
jgi:predicted dehydrogenase